MNKTEIEFLDLPDDFFKSSSDSVVNIEEEIVKDNRIPFFERICPIYNAYIDGSSMEPSLKNKHFYRTRPRIFPVKRNKIYLLTIPNMTFHNNNKYLIKRCVAVSGDSVRYNDSYVKVTDSYGGIIEYGEPDDSKEYKTIVLQKGQSFFLGDNFYNSNDSRKLGIVYNVNVFRKVVGSSILNYFIDLFKDNKEV